MCLVVGVRHATERAATRGMADGGLGPALVLDRDSGIVAEVLFELISVCVRGVVVQSGTSIRQPALTPGLGGILVLGRAELTGSLRLLLESLLVLGVGVANLDLEFLGRGLVRVVVVCLDDLFAGVAVLEAVLECQYSRR